MMITLRIKNRKIECPTTSYEIGYFLGNFLNKIKEKNLEDPELMKRLLLAQITDTSEVLWREVMKEDIDIVFAAIPFLNNHEFGRITNGIIINNDIFLLTPKDEITCEQYMDLDKFFKEDDGYFGNAAEVAAILYRSTTTKEGFPIDKLRNSISSKFDLDKELSINNVMINDYDVKIAESNVNPISHEYSYGFLISCFKYFSELKVEYAEDFPILFGTVDDEPDIEESPIPHTPTMSEIWGIRHYIEIITGGNIIEQDYWAKQPVVKLFSELCYRSQAHKNKDQ